MVYNTFNNITVSLYFISYIMFHCYMKSLLQVQIYIQQPISSHLAHYFTLLCIWRKSYQTLHNFIRMKHLCLDIPKILIFGVAKIGKMNQIMWGKMNPCLSTDELVHFIYCFKGVI